ncbi:MAG: ATP-binding protein [Rubrivivax sp.]
MLLPARALLRIALRLAAALLGAMVLQAAAQPLVLDQALRGDDRTGGRFAEATAVPVTLPDDWSRTRPGSAEPAVYRVRFPLSQVPAAPLALQLTHACAAIELQLNGHLVQRDTAPESGSTTACGVPRLVPLPPALLRPGPNVLDLRLSGLPLEQVGSRHRAAALAPLVVGSQDDLQPRQHRRQLAQVSLRQALGATLLLTGGYMFVLGFLNRRESHLAYFGVVSVCWALLDAPLWLREAPLPPHAWELLMAALLPLLTQAAVQFLLRYARLRHRLVDRALPAQCVLMPLTLAAAGPQQLHAWTQGWTALLALQALAAAATYLHRQWRERSPSFWVMGALLALVAVAGLVEAVAQTQAVPPAPVLLARLLVPLAFVLVGLRLVHQHGQALQAAEASKARLEQRVREAAAEIERNFRQLSELKIEQVTERERKRIAADLHDDLGAKLLTIVHTSESDRISTLAREALEEMRLSVRGLTGRPVRLADALGDWRAEVVSRLAQAGIEAEWSAPEDLPQTLSARAYVQTTRILREATSNIIKHSGASYCSVRCQVADGDFQLVVQDNGEGIVSEPDGRLDRGHGMATMKQRAKQMQGQCLVETGPGFGTVIRLTLPLDRALEGA